MKKYLFAIIILLIPCYSFAVIPQVSDLYPKNKVFGLVDKVWTVPAKVLGRSSTSIATDTIGLGLTKAIAGGIVTYLAIAGVSYVANEYIDWLMGQTPPMYYSQDGVLTRDIQNTAYGPPEDAAIGANAIGRCETSCGVGHCILRDVCYTRASDCSTIPAWYGGGLGWFSSSVIINGFIYDYTVWQWAESPTKHYVGVVYTCTNQQTRTVPTAVTYPDLYNLVAEDIDDATDETAPIVDIVNKGIDKAADLTAGGAGIKAAPGTLPRAIEDIINQAIPDDVATDLEEKLNDPTVVDEAIDKDVADTDSQKSITDGVTDAMKSFFGDDVAVPVDVTPGLPSKLSLTSIMQSFMNSINNMPIISTLRGITINASGSSVLCVDLPANYGGSRCYDAASAQSTFNMIGTILLSMTTIFCFIQLFRG
jgi:hypothetical protein